MRQGFSFLLAVCITIDDTAQCITGHIYSWNYERNERYSIILYQHHRPNACTAVSMSFQLHGLTKAQCISSLVGVQMETKGRAEFRNNMTNIMHLEKNFLCHTAQKIEMYYCIQTMYHIYNVIYNVLSV